MKAKEFIIELKKQSKPRNFVAKNASLAGKAGQHKDKKKAEKQGDVKHKKELATMESALSELSTEKLAQYKKAAGADAKKADADGNYSQGNKRFKGINRATNKQFDNDLKKRGVAEDFEDMPDELMDPAVWKTATLKQKYKAVVDAGLIEKPYQSSYIGWMNDEINRITGKPYDDSGIPRELKNGELDLNKVYRSALAKYQDRKHSSDLTSQDREHELTIGTAGRAEMIRKANELAEMKRVTLRNERLQDEEVAFQRAETIQQRKDEMKKIADKYQHDLTVIDKEHRNNMESIRTGNNHEINKIDKEHAEARREREHSSSESDKDRAEREREREQNRPKPEKPKPVEMPEPEEEPRPRPRPEAGNKFDQDTGEPIRPQSNQWHTSQQVGYRPSKPSKDNDDDIIDVEPKPNKPLRIKEKITVVKDPAKATGIQRTGGITHGSVYSGKPAPQPYRITPGATYTPGKPLPQSLQQKLDGKPNTDRAVDAKGRTQQQWVKLVKAKFPDAKIMQSKMLDGPVFAMLPDGRKLSWNKVEKSVEEGFRDPKDWDEGNTEPPNNFAVYINGKKWKVFKGRGRYADDQREQAHYQQLKDWAAKKSVSSGKQWTVSITGETATESLDEVSWKGIKQGAAAAGLAGAMAFGAGSANARVTPDGQGGYTGGFKPTATVTAPSDTKPAADAPAAATPTGFSKQYLQKAANPDRFGRYMISVEKAQELLKQMDTKVGEGSTFAGAKVGHKEGPAGQWRNDGAKKNKPARPGDLVGGGM